MKAGNPKSQFLLLAALNEALTSLAAPGADSGRLSDTQRDEVPASFVFLQSRSLAHWCVRLMLSKLKFGLALCCGSQNGASYSSTPIYHGTPTKRRRATMHGFTTL